MNSMEWISRLTETFGKMKYASDEEVSLGLIVGICVDAYREENIKKLTNSKK